MNLNKHQLQVGSKKLDNELLCKGTVLGLGLTAVIALGAYLLTKKGNQ